MRVNTVTVAGRLIAPADQGGPPERPWGRLRVDVGISKPRELTVWVYGELLPIAAALRGGDEVLVHGQLREHPERDELAVVAAALGAADAPAELGEAEPFEDPEPMFPERELIGAGVPQPVPGRGVQAIADRIMQRASGHEAGPRPARAG